MNSVPRIDAAAIVDGTAAYSADLIPRHALHMAVLRSPHARARIVAVDLSDAQSSANVVRAFDGEALRSLALPLVPSLGFQGPAAGRGDLQSRCLAVDEVCYVGQPVAAVVASNRHDAQAALLRIVVDYAPMQTMLDAEAALSPGSTFAHPGWETNLVAADRFDWGDAEAAFASAFRVVEGVMEVSASVAAPMETLCYIGDWDARSQRMTATGTYQNPHASRLLIAEALGLNEGQVRVVAPRMGGAFGSKMAGHPAEVLVCALSRALRRPVAYKEPRADNLALSPGRSQRHRFGIAANADGRITAFRDSFIADVGIVGAGYGWCMPLITSAVFPTVYAIPNGAVDVRLAATNKAPWQPIRGYGKEVTNLVMEHAIDRMALALGIDPVALRQRNLVAKAALPRRLPSSMNVDSGDYSGALDQLVELFGYADWRARQARAEGTRVIGIGIGFELTPEGGVRPGVYGNTFETATVRLTPYGVFEVLTGVTSPGTGNETGMAQMVAAVVGVEPAAVRVIQGDTDITPVGMGNASSKALLYGGTSAHLAALKVRDKVLRCASNHLKRPVEAIVLVQGRAVCIDEPRVSVAIADLARLVFLQTESVAHGVDMPLEATESFRPVNIDQDPDPSGRKPTYPSFPYSVHAAAVALDTETGQVEVLDFAVVHDCGVVVNPLLVTSQLRGAVCMGIGMALWERLGHDATGRPMNDRLKSYLLPRAPDIPPVRVGHRCTPSPFHPLGMKGAGESGVGGAVAAVTNAVSDAMARHGAWVKAVPATPERVLAWLSHESAMHA